MKFNHFVTSTRSLSIAMVTWWAAATCCAADPEPGLVVSVEIPRLSVSEYHRPYVAVWVQDRDRNAVANLAVWYQMRESAQGAGTKWLPDLRQWWRRSGRRLQMPVDGVSGATKPAGTHEVSLSPDDPKLTALPAGKYTLVVEAAREVGGRELLEIPFDWPSKEARSFRAEGKEELGEIVLNIQPSN